MDYRNGVVERRVAWSLRMPTRLFRFPKHVLWEIKKARYCAQMPGHASLSLQYQERRVAWSLRMPTRLSKF
jgi:hypothetical protein